MLFSMSCKKNNDTQVKFPVTKQEIEQSIKITKQIANETSILVDSAISKAYHQDGLVNPTEIAKSIELIEDVISATPTSTGTGIIIEQKDKTFSNILIVKKDDDRLFKLTTRKSSEETNVTPKNSNSNTLIPNGSKKALILAPFQASFNTDLAKISALFQSAGFEVDEMLNSQANLNSFRGKFLINYDIVYISTHGLANGMTWGGTESTLLLTGEEVDFNKFNSLTESERESLAISYGTDGISYYAISVPWLNLTTKGTFTNSWIFADACESSEVDDGPISFSEAFLKLGAGGFNGYDGIINILIANPIAVTMTEKFSSSLSFSDASDAVRNELSLVLPTIVPIILFGDEFNIASFDDNQGSTDPFYLYKSYDQITDIDGNSYNIGSFGSQTWMLENLKTTKYNDGLAIPLMSSENPSSPGCLWYNFDINNKNSYGGYYNFYAVNTGKLCPLGWHVPNYNEWLTFRDYLISCGFNYDGTLTDNKIAKSIASATEWKVSFEIGTPGSYDYPSKRNVTGFSARPVSGCFVSSGLQQFGIVGEDALWWSSTEDHVNGATFAQLPYSYAGLTLGDHSKDNGWSVRCVKDN